MARGELRRLRIATRSKWQKTRVLPAEVFCMQAKGGFALRFGATPSGAVIGNGRKTGNLLRKAVTALMKWMDGWANPAGDEQQRTSSRPEYGLLSAKRSGQML